jgi:sorting nexin-4
VTTASETSDAFSDETLKEYAVFQYAKQAEMKELLGTVADGQIETYRKVCRDCVVNKGKLNLSLQAMEEWEKIIPVIQRIRVEG